MNKFVYALLRELGEWVEKEKEYTINSKIIDLFTKRFNEFTWSKCIVNIELFYGLDIPDQLVEQTQLTILDFGKKLALLSPLPEEVYPEYFKLKTSMMVDIERLLQIEINFNLGFEEGTPEEIIDIKKRMAIRNIKLKEITKRLPN